LPGKHEPTSKRSLYLSVATSTLRGIILVGLVVLGILGLTKLFPENASLGVTPGSTRTTAPSTGSSSPSPTPTPTKSRKARPKGQVTVLVLNGTSKTGEASLVTERLKQDGYNVKNPANYTTKVQTTIIYYQADSFPEAQRLQRQRFAGAELKPAPATIPQDVDLEVIVGADQL
jgi:LytR cell envelope-related transcriptional attenuator